MGASNNGGQGAGRNRRARLDRPGEWTDGAHPRGGSLYFLLEAYVHLDFSSLTSPLKLFLKVCKQNKSAHSHCTASPMQTKETKLGHLQTLSRLLISCPKHLSGGPHLSSPSHFPSALSHSQQSP